MPASQWIQLPDGPWVLPDLEGGIYVRLVAKLERKGHLPCFTVTGPGYDTTEHPSIEEAMEAAEADRYQPWFEQPLNDWPPMPEVITAWPLELFVKETVWPYWEGSSTEIAGLAKRAEHWMNQHFHRFQDLPRDAWYIRPGVLRQQEAVNFSYSVLAAGAALGAPTPEALRDEIQARRSGIRQIVLKASATDRTWSRVALAEHNFADIFEQVPLKPIPPPDAPPRGISASWDVYVPPLLIELRFEDAIPAVRLRTVAPSARICASLHEYMRPHVDAGRRKAQVWDPALTGGVAAILGCAVPDVFLLVGTISPGATMLIQVVLGPLGMLVGLRVIDWAFPSLEIVETWQRSRWQRTKTVFWQGVLFGLALLGIVITILLASPATTPRP